MKNIYCLLLFSVICVLQIAAVPAGVPLWQVLGLTDDSVITTESKLDQIALEFSGVFTALQDITDIVVSDVSKLDNFNFIINVSLDVSQLDAINSGIDVVQSLVDSLEGCGVSGAISQADISATFTINTSGSYFLTEDITFSPVAPNQNAIEIDADNVYLDLNGFTITQGNTVSGTGAISVLANRRNIKILNGIVRNMSGQTIFFNTNVNNVYVKDMQVLSAGLPGGGGNIESADGIEAVGGSNYVFNNLVVQDSQDEGIDINGVLNFVLKNSNFSFNGSSGIAIDDDCRRGVIDNCICEQNRLNGITTFFSEPTGIVVTGCRAARNGAAGISGASFNWAIEDCDMLSNRNEGIETDLRGSTFIKNNMIVGNAGGIDLGAGGLVPGGNSFVFRNTLIQNGSRNLRIQLVSGANSVLGNYAFNTTDGTNYTSNFATTINRRIVNTTGSFVDQPVFWRNISAIP